MCNYENEPSWAQTLRISLMDMADDLCKKLSNRRRGEKIFYPEDFACDGMKIATEAIQKAIDFAARSGGGTVKLEKGEYISGTIVLRSNVCLEIAENSVLSGSTDLNDYPPHIAKRTTVMDTHMGMNQSLIFAEECENISICGNGIIDGRGSRENFPGDETVCSTPGRPFLMRIIDCKNVHISDIHLKDSPCWMQNYLNCENMVIENIDVENQSNYNNDGIDLDGCRNVIVRNCRISSGDDAFCLKGASQKASENILVENCLFYSSCNAIKIGTDTQGDFRNILIRSCKIGGVTEDMRRIKSVGADSGISIEMVDGGIVENVLISDIRLDNCRSPLFMRLDNRARVKPDDAPPPIGTVQRIIIENVTGGNNGTVGSYFLGIPEKRICDVLLKNISLYQKASEKPITQDSDFSEMKGWYPDAQMIKNVGDAPSYGLWARHCENLSLINYCVMADLSENRPRISAENDVVNFKDIG